ncbi:MAG TPA: type II toxin-antitoxin system VapC family toxin [Silvibacterium sp.]|nr:type II toxin-antitoxin system VapC family toxin [Silvibacterium sp.]
MRVLLDTHTLLWAALDPPRLSPKARALLSALSTDVFVSAASAWEIATKVRIGKLPGAGAFAADFAARIERLGFHGLPVTLEHGQRAGLLPGAHKDPFDRMLIAQAQAENIPLVSNERTFDGYGIRRIW